MSMKKSLVSALTTALVVGAASTTFAAANPFEDVPADHWAYDAVAQLAADGVIEGYGDGTYRGDQEITRYEMAQMIARAMAKNPNGVDKALVDKLAAEFADELNNLGVRVSALEKKVDNVKWYGLFRYTYSRSREENDAEKYAQNNPPTPNHQNTNNFRLRLSMSAQINEHWTGNARMEYGEEGDNMDTAKNDTTVLVNRAWVEGHYGATMIQLGKFPGFSYVDNGLVFDDDLAGGLVQFGDKANIRLMVARYDTGNTGLNAGTASYQSIELNSDPNKKFTAGVGYHHFATRDLNGIDDPDKIGNETYNADQINLWTVGLGYRFDKNTKLSGAFARNTSGDFETKHRQSWNVEFDYKGADYKDPGSWGAFVAYRHIGKYGSFCPTYNSMFLNQKGFNVGVKYTLMKNVLTMVEYYNGKNITNDKKQDTIFARAEIYF